MMQSDYSVPKNFLPTNQRCHNFEATNAAS